MRERKKVFHGLLGIVFHELDVIPANFREERLGALGGELGVTGFDRDKELIVGHTFKLLARERSGGSSVAARSERATQREP